MRCYCCNKILTTAEATAKFAVSGNFTEMCNGCLTTIVEDVAVQDTDTIDQEDTEEGKDKDH